MDTRGKNLVITVFIRFLSDFLRLFLLNKTLDIVYNNNQEEPSFPVQGNQGQMFESLTDIILLRPFNTAFFALPYWGGGTAERWVRSTNFRLTQTVIL